MRQTVASGRLLESMPCSPRFVPTVVVLAALVVVLGTTHPSRSRAGGVACAFRAVKHRHRGRRIDNIDYDHGGDAVRVLIVDDSPVFAGCIAAGLRLVGDAEIEVFDGGVDAEGLTASLEQSTPDAVVIDLDLEGHLDSLRLLHAIKGFGVDTFVITAFVEHPHISELLSLGAAGVFARTRAVDDLVSALDDALCGRTTLDEDAGTALTTASERAGALLDRLTPSERAVLDLLADGQPAKMVARTRGVSVFTVRAQIRSILTKLGVNSQLAAVALLHRDR